MVEFIENIILFFNKNGIFKELFYIILITFLSYLSYLITKKVIIKWIGKIVKKSKTTLDDLFFNNVISNRLSFIPPILVIYYFTYLYPDISTGIHRLLLIIIILLILTTFSSFLKALNILYDKKKNFKGRPIKGYIQAINIILYIFGLFIIVGIITGQSVLALLSGIGALTAVLILVFRDTILSFIASIEITTNDLVRMGDWIEAKKFGADGDVVDIALHTIKIQNWDKTITVVPTHKLIDESFKNWRGMTESGGRRIKRTIHIDISSIKICTDEMIEKYEKIELLNTYLLNKKKEISESNKKNNIKMDISMVNGRRLTNIGTFRAYIKAYLKNNSNINDNMTFLIRQLQSGPEGLPIQIYVFSNDVRWANYEDIQSDIFDHIFFNIRRIRFKGFSI